MSFPKQRIAMALPPSHVHVGCDHWCFCHRRSTDTCLDCRRQHFDVLMAQQRYEDRLSTTELLDRRA
jgi:hypothetical protein